ncbi:hypothetical protein [Aromatoleum petrolei]|uniref:Uncharacterized protein n=1 Tax=Aromatoleum petrolei TaxID=76116 RepID=A0ABX1MWR7_9RHOO|nr:hypothetical protein [Aromatoleum petrolei]NMF90414.1 hypothetical protein [Aromatoleum petrolei]QTQ35692.1 Uncharacterized protein ToN1_15340 [Aromatoleum petrolei]
MVLAAGVVLAVAGLLVFVMQKPWRSTGGEGAVEPESVDLVGMSAPVVTDVRQERLPEVRAPVMPPVQEFRAPAATIVEMPVQRVELPNKVDSPPGVANVSVAGGRRPSEAAGRGAMRVAPREVARTSTASAKSKPGGGRKADARRGAPPVRTQPGGPKHVEERVDADVQVIEAIVTRTR